MLGTLWHMGEAIAGTEDGIRRASTIRRIGAHRRWDAELPAWNPDAEIQPGDFHVRWLAVEGDARGKTETYEEEENIHRLPFRREDFVQRGFMENCAGGRALLSGSSRQGHSKSCRFRMEDAIRNIDVGQSRMHRQAQT